MAYASAALAFRLVIGEDSYIVREGLRRLLETSAEVEIVAACADLESLSAAVDEHRPDVVVTDIRMPPNFRDEGLQLAERLRSVTPPVGVVLLSQYLEADYALRLLERGAAGRSYLLKERVADLDQLLNAIREVARGGSVVDPKVVEELIAAGQRRQRSPLRDLTPREREVLGKVAEGMTNAAIGRVLFLSERAVEKHINAIFSKLGLGEEPDVHRRVRATLVYLAEQHQPAP